MKQYGRGSVSLASSLGRIEEDDFSDRADSSRIEDRGGILLDIDSSPNGRASLEQPSNSKLAEEENKESLNGPI